MAEDITGGAFSREQVQNALLIRDTAKEIAGAMKEAFKGDKNFTNQQVKDLAGVANAADKFANAQQQARKNTKNLNALLKTSNDLQAKSAKFAAEIRRNEKLQSDNLDKINKKRREANAEQRELTAAEKAQIDGLKLANEELDKKNRLLADAKDNTDTLQKDYSNLAAESNKMGKSIYSAAAGLSDFLGLSQHVTDGFREANEVYRERKIMLQEQSMLQDKINALVDIENEKRKKLGKEKISAKDVLEKGTGLTKDNLQKLQAKGMDLSDVTGGETGGGAAKRLRARRTSLAKATPSPFAGIGKALKGLIQVGKQFLKVLVVAKMVAKVVEMVEYAISGVDKEAVDLARSMNLGRDAGYAMRDSIREAASQSKILGASHIQLVKMQLAYTETTKTVYRLNQDQLETMSLMTKQMGFSNEAAAHSVELFKASGMGAREGLEALNEQYRALRQSNKTHHTLAALMDDISSDAELTYIFQTQGAAAAMRNAAAVRRTGLSLAQQRSMAEGTLDFEKTMTNQFELQLLTGKEINMQRAMELALQGKNGAAVAEMHKQMRGLTAEQRKNPLIMNKMLEMLGMSREEYYKMISAQKEAAALAKSQAKAQEEFDKGAKIRFEQMHRANISSLQQGYDMFVNFDAKKGEAFKKEVDAIKKQILEEAKRSGKKIDNIQAEEQAYDQAHAKFLHNAKVEAGIDSAKIKALESQRSAGEAFADAMEELKTLFADLVGSGSIQYLTTTLVDFVQRAKQVGFGKAMLGLGTGEKEIEADYGAGAMSEVRNISSGAEDDRIKGALKSAELLNDAMDYWAGTDEGKAQMALSGIKTATDLKAIVEAYDENYGGGKKGSFYKDIRGDFNSSEIVDIMNQLNQQSGGTMFDAAKYQRDMEAYQLYQSQIAAGVPNAEYKPYPKMEDYQVQNVDDFIMRPGKDPIKFNKGDLIMGGTNLGGGKSNRVEQLLERLVGAVESGGNVYIDGNKVGNAMVLASSKLS